MPVGAFGVAAKNKLRVAIAGGIFSAFCGSLLGAVVIIAVAFKARSFSGPADAISAIPLAFVFASLVAVPFGLIAGSCGALWLASKQTVGNCGVIKRAAIIGGIIGLSFPVIAWTLGWGPFKNLLEAIPLAVLFGAITGAAFAAGFLRVVGSNSSIHCRKEGRERTDDSP